MRKKTRIVLKDGLHPDDPALTALAEMEAYRGAHPKSPSAVRRPSLSIRSGLWIAVLGPSVEEGIVGIGPTVEAALRAFDAQYLAGLRPPVGPIKRHRKLRISRPGRSLNSISESHAEV
jgi:hypothetical protein